MANNRQTHYSPTRIIISIIFILLIVFIIYYFYNINKPINIFFIGQQENHHITQDERLAIRNQYIGKDINLNDIKATIEEIPWVAQANIQRASYDKNEYNKKFGTHEDFRFLKPVLEVNITERIPIAYWQSSNSGYLVDKNGHIFKGVLNANDPPIFVIFAGIQQYTCINTIKSNQKDSKDTPKDNKQTTKNCMVVDNAKDILDLYNTIQKEHYIEGLTLGNDTLYIRQIAQDSVGIWWIWVWAFDNKNNYDSQKSFVIKLGLTDNPIDKIKYFSHYVWDKLPKDKPIYTIDLSYNNHNFAVCSNISCRME